MDGDNWVELIKYLIILIIVLSSLSTFKEVFYYNANTHKYTVADCNKQKP